MLHKFKVLLLAQLKTRNKRNKKKAKWGLGSIKNQLNFLKEIVSGISSANKIPKQTSEYEVLDKKLNELVSIAKTKNEEYIEQLFLLANAIDEYDQTILMKGETGVGKSYLAAQIHKLSQRKNKKFIAINCAGLSKTEIYANLFGAEKGSYTGSRKENRGKIKAAEGGTLFIDEIDKTPQDVRHSLLIFLDTKRYYQYGGNEELDADVRIIVGTNRDLKELVRKGEFEEDFYYRITKRVFHIPPLRQRKEDIPIIIKWVLEKFNSQKGINITVDKKAVDLLSEYPWYGNFRELDSYMTIKLSNIYMWVDTITPEIILENPPEKYPLKSDNHLENIEKIIKNNLSIWDPEEGKYISDFVEPVIAKIYLEDINPQMNQSKKYEDAMSIIGISGDRRTSSTLHKQYLKYKEIKKKYS
jgi:transcriptional regulator with PAS, ATPase and Fis domain